MNKKEILKKIKDGEIKMKPRWEFKLKELGTEGIGLMVVTVAAVALSALYYFIKIYDPREWLPFEEIGWQIFLEDFPYYWLILNIFLVCVGVWLWSRVGQNYKKTWGRLALVVVGGVLLLSIGLILLQGL
jgi:hypothetical protein